MSLPAIRIGECSTRSDPMTGKRTHATVEPVMGQGQCPVNACLLEDAVPAAHSVVAIGEVLGSEILVQRDQGRDIGALDAPVDDHVNAGGELGELVVVGSALFLPAP